MNFYPIIIDVIVVLIFAVAIYTAFKRGFLRSIVMLVGCVASLVLASKLSQTISVYIYEQFMYEKIVISVNEAIAQSVENIDISAIVSAIENAIPSGILNIFGGSSAIQNAINSSTGTVTAGTGEAITQGIVTPIILPLLQTILCVILFLLLMVLVKLIAGIFKGFYAIPIIGPINSFLGGIIGLVQGGVIIWILAIISALVISATNGTLVYLNDDIINATHIFRYFGSTT